MATVDAPSSASFAQWVRAAADRPFELALKREHGAWYATLLDFDISGMGATPAEAVDEALTLLSGYLHAYYEDGIAFDDTLRPVPRSQRLKLEAEAIYGRIARRISVRLPLSSESTYMLPPGALSNLVHC